MMRIMNRILVMWAFGWMLMAQLTHGLEFEERTTSNNLSTSTDCSIICSCPCTNETWDPNTPFIPCSKVYPTISCTSNVSIRIRTNSFLNQDTPTEFLVCSLLTQVESDLACTSFGRFETGAANCTVLDGIDCCGNRTFQVLSFPCKR